MHGTRLFPRSILFLAVLLIGCETNTPSDSSEDGSNFDVEITEPPANLCVEPGTAVDFVAEYSHTAGNPSVRWTTDNTDVEILFPTVQSLSLTFTELGTYNITVTGYDDGVMEPTDTRTIVVDLYCAIFVEIETPEEGAIYGPEEPITFSATVSGATPPIEYDWDFSENSGIPDSEEQNPVGSVATVGSYSATLTVTDADQEAASATVNFEVADITGVDSPLSNVKSMSPTPPNFGGSNTPDGGVMLFGNNGAALFDPISATFGDVHLPAANFFRGAVAETSTGTQAIIGYDFYSVYISYYDEGAGAFAAAAELHPARGNDLSSFNHVATGGGFVFCTSSGVEVYEEDGGSDTFVSTLSVPESQFPGMSEQIFGVCARDGDSGFLAYDYGTPSYLWHHDGEVGNDAVQIGALGSSPVKLRCLDEIAVVVDGQDDTCTVITWSAGGAVSIAGSFATGDSPEGCDLMLLGGGNYGCIVPGRHDQTITIAEISPAGAILSTNSIDMPIDCGSPPDATWLRNGSTDFLVTCLSGDNVFVMPSGL